MIEQAFAEQNARIELMNNLDPNYGLNIQANDLVANLANQSLDNETSEDD